MKKGWEMKRLGDVCEVVSGSTPKTSIPEYWLGENFWVTPAELGQDEILYSTERRISDEAVKKTNLTILPVGSVLLSSRAPIGKVAITGVQMATNQGFKNFICSEKVSNRFLFWFLKSKTLYLNSLGRGATFKEISKSIVEAVQIPLPDVCVQENVIRELDTLNDIITKKKQQLEELDKLAQATFYEMFGDLKSNSKMWNFFLLKDVCTVIVDCPHSTPVKSTFPTSYPCIRTSELKNGQIVWKSMQYVDEIEYKKRIARLKPRKGDIVYGREGSYGDAVCLPGGFDFCLGQRTMLFRPNSKVIESVFLLYTLLSDFVYDQAKLKNSGSTVGHVNVADIKKFKIPLPPIEKQQTFIGNIVIIESQKSLLHQSLTDTQQIFDYTMNKYFGS